MAMVVRPRTRLSRAFWISFSVSVSTDEVASSRMRIFGSMSRAGRWKCAGARHERALAPLADQPGSRNRGQAQDELVGVGGAGGGDDLVRLASGFAIGDVLGDCAEEEEGFLQYQADIAAELGHRHRAHIDAVNQHRPSVTSAKAADQIHQVLLPEPGWPTRPIISPGWMVRLTSQMTARVP